MKRVLAGNTLANVVLGSSLCEKNGTVVPSHSFEEAISLLPIGKFHYKLLLVGGLCFMTVMVEIMCVSIILPSMRCDLESTVAQQGILASAGFLGIVLSSHSMGFLADTWGRVRTLRLAFTLACISTAISAFSVNIWMLIVFRFLSGFVISGGQACVFSMAGEFHGNRTRTRHVTLLSGFLPLSLVYLPTMATFILPLQIDTMLLGMKFSSWRILILSNCGLSLLTLLGLSFIPETPKYMLVQGDNNAALETLRWIFVQNTGKSVAEFPVRHITPQTGGANLANIGGVKDALKMIWSQTKPLFAKERYLHTINICIINMTVYCISQGLFMWFPTLLNEMVASNVENPLVCYTLTHLNDASSTGASDVCSGNVDIFPFLIIILVGAAFTVFYLIFSFTIDFIGKKNLILTWLVVSCICVTLLHWTTNFYVIVTLLTFTMSVGNVGGLVSTISMEFFPTNINAMGMCFIMMIGRIGAVLGSNFIGVLLFSWCDYTFWAMSGACIVLLVLCWFLPERKYNKTKKVIHATTG